MSSGHARPSSPPTRLRSAPVSCATSPEPGTLLAYRAGATLRNAEFSYVRPGTPKFYFEGITFAIQEGARFTNAKGEAFMRAL